MDKENRDIRKIKVWGDIEENFNNEDMLRV